MPTYNLRNKNTGEETTQFMFMSELDQYLIDNPHMETVPASPAIVSGVASARMKPDDGFRDLLRTIKKANPKSDVNTW